MDSDSSRHDNQESKLHSHVGNSKPDIMQLQYLKEITDNFSDERVLGQGGFGVVYKGVPQNGEMVAIKKLLQPMPNFLKQFKNEVDLLMRLKHPNIVRLIGYCYETQNVHMDHNGKFIFAEVTQCLLCLEFLPKGSLDAYISDESCGLDWLTRYTIIEGICNGLQYLHEQINPIIHLDLKPANILLTNNMVPKLTDFGLSRLLDQQQTMCTLIATGTRGYMPPEYIQGGTITPMSDIFSLGVIILELVTGHRDYPDLTRTSSEEFIELTLKKWSNVLAKAPGYPSLEIECQQIKKCIQIGLMCVNPERTKRPTAAKVIKMLQGLESMDCQGGNEITSSSPQSRSGPRELLDIYPLELCFSLDPEKPCLVKLTNKTDGYVAFHFKATRATMRYCIEPSSGFLWPRSPLNVVLKIEERCELPPDLQCHDEFLVQSITVSMERLVSEHITEDTFNKVSSKAVQKVNLTVVYEPPAQPPPLLRVGSDETNTTNLQQLEGLPVEAAGEEALKDDVYTAAAYGDLERLQRLVEAEGQQVTEPDRLGYHALHWAALNNRVGAAKYILEHGADVNAVDCTGQTALHWSSVRGHVQVAELLLKEGAKADAADLYGYQVTHVAAQYGQTLFIHHVVAKWNANPDVPDYNGRSPLHWAAYKGFADSIRLLLHLDAYRLRLDIEGCTPLHWAAIMGNLGACTVLVQAGKKDDLTLKDKTGLTPAQLAAEKRHREVAAFLVSSAESIIALVAPIDFVKQRMEATYAALQNAAELAQLSQSVEHVFSVGDLPEAAETLATMRHCLSAGGEVAEFAKTRKQLEVLEERLDEIIQPCLFDTLSNHKVDAVQDFRGMLTCIRNFNSWKVRDTKIHVKPLKELWEDFDVNQRANRVEMMKPGWESISSVSFSSWLPSFYDETVLYLEQEWKWCSTIFPGGFRSLVPIVLVETMSELNSSFVSRLNKATGYSLGISYVAKGVLDVLSGDLPKSIKLQNAHLVALIELHNMTGTFARNIRHLFLESDRGVLLNTMKAIYSPYETFKVRYGQMEYAVLAAAIASIDSRGTIPGGAGAQGLELSETVHRMNKSIPQMIAFLEAAVERCISLTGGSEADELVLVLDDIMLQYISNLQETLKPLRTVCGLDATAHCDASKKDAGLEKKEATRLARVAFQVLTIAECLTSRTSVFEASLRDSLARIGAYFSRSRSRFTLDIATIRLTSLPDKSEKLFAVLEQSKDLRFHVLPVASQRVVAFSEIVNELVYDVLMSRVRQSLNEIALLPIWSSMEEQSGPSFSAYPQEYVTSVGDYLLTLPQHCLEPLDVGITGSGAGSDVPEFNAEEWISKVAEGATALFMEQLRGIHYITDRGALQLAADIEYLNNVLSALSMPIPPFLSTFHACISTPRDQVRSLIKSDGGSQLDLPTAHLVSKIRRIPLDQ